MKVVINKCYGGFGLSDIAVERCLALGMTLTEFENNQLVRQDADFARNPDEHSYLGRYFTLNSHERSFRCDPRVIQAVVELGNLADGRHAELKVIDIPFDSSKDGALMNMTDGKRSAKTIEPGGDDDAS